MHHIRAAIYGKSFEEHCTPHIQQLLDRLTFMYGQLCIYEPFYDFLKPRIKMPKNVSVYTKKDTCPKDVAFVFSVGGDGTFLNATSFVRDSETPIIGINTGRLGFLAQIPIYQIEEALEAIENGEYDVDKRTTIKVDSKETVAGDVNFALNEVTIHKKDTSSMITVHVYIDGEYLNTYWSDGLIVATPTGSTAYNLSVGGPIIWPDSDTFVISPISPHNLTARPIIIPDSKVITLRVEGRTKHFMMALDSRSETIEGNQMIVIKKNNFGINLVRMKGRTFSNTLREKLNWGVDKRN